MARVVTMREDADVASVADRDARIQRRLEARLLLPDARRLGVDTARPATVREDRVARGHGWAEDHALLRHHLEHLGCAPVAVLDRLHAGLDGAPHPLGGAGVRDYGTSRAPRHLHDELDLLCGERRPRLAVRPPAIIGVNLDPVRAALDLVAHYARQLVDAARFFRALRNVVGVFGRESLRAIAAGCDDSPGGNDHPRPRDDVLIDRLLEANVRVPGTLSPEVAHRRPTGHERAPGVVDSPGDAERESFVQHLVVPRRLVVRMKEKMRMPL